MMRARITRLQTWRSEYSAETCQDRLLDNLASGLFAVADGAGTTTFPSLWADVLVKHFLRVPLMSDNPFEVEWWVRLAQERYTAARPRLESLSSDAREKESTQGSESTLATIRIARVDAASASAGLLVFGDSCVLIGRAATGQVETFPLEKAADFDRHPICLPSNPEVFQRKFHRCKQQNAEVQAGDVLLLATDAVSRWIIGKGNGQYKTIWESFHEVIQRTPGADWQTFIEEQRRTRAMADDDSTALVIELQPDTFVFPAEIKDGAHDVGRLGTTTRHTPEIVKQRKANFAQARKDRQSELEAIYFGDGTDLGDLLDGQILQADIERARKVADALRAVISASAAFYKKPNFVPKMQEVWAQYKEWLQDEPCAEGIRATLQANGVFGSSRFTLAQVTSVKRLYLAHRIEDYEQWTAPDPRDEAALWEQRARLQQELDNPQILNERTVEELGGDVLTQQAIEGHGRGAEELPDFALLPELDRVYQAIAAALTEPAYAALLQEQRLTRNEVRAILTFLIRWQKFHAYEQGTSHQDHRKSFRFDNSS